MTTYNTGNPIGSTDPKDLYDNAKNLDVLVNSATEVSHADRKGVQRKTWRGMEAQFDQAQSDRADEFAQFMADSAYQELGDYAAGIVITRYNQVFRKDGEWYRPAAALDLPYTTTGVWGDESIDFVGVGDAVLRQDLAAPGGSALVGYDSGTVQSALDALTGPTGAETVGYTPSGTGAVAATVQSKLRERISVKDFGAKGDWDGTTGTDDTAAFNAAITATPEYGTLVIPDGKYLIRDAVLITSKNINIDCSGTVILTDEVNSRIVYANTEVLTFPGTSLSALPKIGDSTLQWTSAPSGVDDASKYFFVLRSTEEEITRVGSSAYTPYTKNECGDITSWGWLLRAAIKLDYTDASKLTVKLYRKRGPVTVRGLRVVMANTMGATSKLYRVVLSGLSNVNFDGLEVDNTAVNIEGQAVRMESCCGLTFSNSVCIGPSAAGDTYGFINDTSAFITFNNCEYRNPYNAALEVERGYAARHGANISFYRCRFNGIDDHYGHDYYIENCTFSGRGVSLAGGNVTIKDINMTGGVALFQLRADTPYAYGKLVIDGGVVDGTDYLISMAVDNDPLNRQTKVRYFDDIDVLNITYNGRKQTPALRIFGPAATAGNVITKTKRFRMHNFVFNRLLAWVGCSIQGISTGDVIPNWVERAEFSDIDYRLIATKSSGSFGETAIITLREFGADEVYVENFRNFAPYSNPQVQKMTVVNSSVGPAAGGDLYFNAGENTFIGCDIYRYFFVPEDSSALFEFIDCTIRTGMYGTGSSAVNLKNRTRYLSRNKATLSGVNLTNAPGGSIEYYINPAYYKTA